MDEANWLYRIDIRFGAGRIAELGAFCRRLRITRPLIVTDPGVAETPAVERALESLRDARLAAAVFAGVRPNPTLETLEAGVVRYLDRQHDGVVAVGGGSAIDCGKVVALAARQRLPARAFVWGSDAWRRADAGAVGPVIAIPTTAGSGAEVGAGATIVDAEAGTMLALYHPQMLPRMVIADPELSLSLPPALTATTGMDAISHSIEALCAPGANPIADGIGLESLRLAHRWLEPAVRDGSDLEARGHMLSAASMGALSFAKGLGAVHALSHAIGALYDAPHGLVNGVLLPHVVAFNREAAETALVGAARALALPGGSSQAVVEWLASLRGRLGIPVSLGEVLPEDWDPVAVAERALEDPSAATNPRPLDRDAALRILSAAA